MNNTLRIVILSENTAEGRGLRGEHGLAFWVERGDNRLLFDTGQGLVWSDNAAALRLDPARLDGIVLSHGHYDHTGGLEQVLGRVAKPIPVYAHPDALLPKYRRTDAGVREVGMPTGCRKALDGSHAQVVLDCKPADVAPGIRTTGEIPRQHPVERAEERFYRDADGRLEDPVLDDEALILETSAGIVVLLGCAHAGVINTLEHVRMLTAGAPIRAVVGGMHLRSASTERITWTLCELRRFDIGTLIPLHCTGQQAAAALWHTLPKACKSAGAGTELKF